MVIQVDIGKMREVVDIQEATPNRGSAGGETLDWFTLRSVFADVMEHPEEEFTVMMRYYPGLTPTARRVEDADGNQVKINRLKHGVRLLNIVDTLDIRTQGRIMKVLCKRDTQVFVSDT